MAADFREPAHLPNLRPDRQPAPPERLPRQRAGVTPVDAKLFAGQLDGFRYADMPDDRETWRQVARGLDAAARQHGCEQFATAPWTVQRDVIESFSKGRLHGEVWDQLPPKRAWTAVMRAVLSTLCGRHKARS